VSIEVGQLQNNLKLLNAANGNPADWIALARAVANAGGYDKFVEDVERRRARFRADRNQLALGFRSATLPASSGGGDDGFCVCWGSRMGVVRWWISS
jgi:hypothetical protein